MNSQFTIAVITDSHIYIYIYIITVYIIPYKVRSIYIKTVRINYRRTSVRDNWSRKCRKIVKSVSITHSERNIWNGPIVATIISREKRKPLLEENGCFTDREYLVCPGISWRFNARSDGNLDVVVLLRRRFDGGMNSFVTQDASLIKERAARGAKCYRRDSRQSAWNFHSQPQEICAESQSRVWRYRSPQWGKFCGNDCSCTRTHCKWYKILR
jgi:hypothetical protein